MKAKNIIIILVAQYLVLVICSGFLEIHAMNTKARDLQALIRTAGDMALDQVQLVDDFMGYGGRDSLELNMPSVTGSGFIKEDMFAGMLGKDSKVESNKEAIFKALYGTNEFKMLTTRLNPIRKPVRYWNSTHTALDWYYIPTISLMGTDFLPTDNATKGVIDNYGNFVPSLVSTSLFNNYGLEKYEKTSGGKVYYNTPINLGITYINDDLLSTMFMNNIDLLMRQKYKANLNTPEGGNGVLKGSTFSDRLKGDLSSYNPIHNGSFTVLRGEQNPTTGNVLSFKGVKPLITYKVVDMFDPANDGMLNILFGANKGAFGSKADYLKNLNSNVINPATGFSYASKPIVVAKITYYLDVIVPYFTAVARDLRSDVGEGASNFVEVLPENANGVAGTRRIAYTRYFAVTP